MPNPTVLGTIVTIVPVIVTPVALIALVARFIARGPAITLTGRSDAPAHGPMLLLAQGGVAVLVAAFSLAVQPATQPRYVIVAVLASAPVVAWACRRAGRSATLVVFTAATVFSVIALRDARNGAAARARDFATDVATIERLTRTDAPVLVASRHRLYPLVAAHPEWQNRLAYLDQADVAGPASRYRTIERDVARVHQRLYGFPPIVSASSLTRDSVFYLLEDPPIDILRAPLPPTYRLERVSSRVVRGVRR
jgi:hypothetical protein